MVTIAARGPYAKGWISRRRPRSQPCDFFRHRQERHSGGRPNGAMLMETGDDGLAQAAAGGDRAAFGMLLERHYDRIFALAFRLTGHRAEAEDLAQDICAALPAKLRGWRGDSRFTTWLYRVVVNATHDRRRRLSVRARAADGWGDWEVARQADIAAEAEGRAWLAAAMASLPVDLRDTVALMVDDGMTQGEAALVLGIAEGTVAWRMSEVKKRLRAIAMQEAQG
jgi:RNA polymerase sigma-70 factor, ECF subfamily